MCRSRRFQGLVGSFFLAAESQFSEECSGAGSGRTGYEDDRFIWAANIFPVGYLSGEYVLQLLFGQGLNSFSDILVDNRCYGQDSDLVVNQVFAFSFGSFVSAGTSDMPMFTDPSATCFRPVPEPPAFSVRKLQGSLS